MTSSSLSVSAIGRLEVGSSRITSRDLKLSALAISTICCWASESGDTGVSGEKLAPSRSRQGCDHARAAWRLSTSLQEPGRARLAADEDVGGDVEIVEEIEFLVDEGDAGAASSRRR